MSLLLLLCFSSCSALSLLKHSSRGVPDNIVCDRYTCNEGKMNMTDNECVKYHDHVFYLQTCNDTSTPYCPPIETPSESYCEYKAPKEVAFAWPGESCNKTIDCAYGKCSDNKCEGEGVNHDCTLNDECSPGLYCDSAKKCVKQQEEGGDCTNDFDCINTHGCNITAKEPKGKCVRYLSVKAHDYVARCENNYNELCWTFMCTTEGDSSYCLDQVKSYARLPIRCTNDADCFTTPDPKFGTMLFSTCTCSHNPWGLAFCPLFPGDEIGHTVRLYLHWWYKSGNATSCNTVRRDNLNCIKDYWGLEKYLWIAYHLNWYEYFPHVQYQDNCGMTIYFQDYWNSKRNLNMYGSDPGDVDDFNGGVWLQVAIGVLLLWAV